MYYIYMFFCLFVVVVVAMADDRTSPENTLPGDLVTNHQTNMKTNAETQNKATKFCNGPIIILIVSEVEFFSSLHFEQQVVIRNSENAPRYEQNPSATVDGSNPAITTWNV